MKVNVYNQNGEETGTALLPKEIFDVKMNPDLVHQVVVSQMANRRKVLAHTKNRGEVRGGGKKPWRQKGTGRARHASIRSPLWRHGGITFGPTKEKVFKKEIPKKMKRLALFMVLSGKVKNNLLILLDKLKLEQSKTKLMAQIIENLKSKTELPFMEAKVKKGTKSSSPIKKGSVLIALSELDKNIILAVRNLPDVKTIQAKDLNCLDLLSLKYLIMPKEAIKVLKETFLK